MKRRRVTVSPSNAPGIPRSSVYLLLGSFRPSAMAGSRTLPTREPNRSHLGACLLGAVSVLARRRAGRSRRPAGRRARRPSRPPARRPRRARPRRPRRSRRPPRGRASPSACAWAASEITSASSATASRSPELGQLGEPEGVEPVAGQQREVGVRRAARRGPRRSAGGSPRRSPRRAARTPPRGRRRAGRRPRRRRAPRPSLRASATASAIRPPSVRRAAASRSSAGRVTRSRRRRPRPPRASG